MINLDGPWHGQTSMFPKGEPMQGLELSPFETAEGDVFVLDRPASSPWMWESWALPNSKGSAFGPATRGPFPLYACCECSGQTLSLPVLPLISARAADRRRHDHDGERRAAHLREVSAPLPGQALCQPQALLRPSRRVAQVPGAELPALLRRKCSISRCVVFRSLKAGAASPE